MMGSGREATPAKKEKPRSRSGLLQILHPGNSCQTAGGRMSHFEFLRASQSYLSAFTQAAPDSISRGSRSSYLIHPVKPVRATGPTGLIFPGAREPPERRTGAVFRRRSPFVIGLGGHLTGVFMAAIACRNSLRPRAQPRGWPRSGLGISAGLKPALRVARWPSPAAPGSPPLREHQNCRPTAVAVRCRL